MRLEGEAMPEEDLRVLARDEATVTRLAEALSEVLRPGDALCLEGGLGTGKTTFVRALVAALGGDPTEVTSPTFTLEHRYACDRGRSQAPHWVLHGDLYRPGPDALRDLLPSMLEARDEGALLAVEWAEPVRDSLLPCLELRLETAVEQGPDARWLTLRPIPASWPALAKVTARWTAIVTGEVDA